MIDSLKFRRFACLVGLALLGSMNVVVPSYARDLRSFKTPDEAAAALVQAARANDERGILAVLGPEGTQIASSGDATEDKSIREKFVSAYDVEHQLRMDGDGRAVLIIGREDFPFPIPLVRAAGLWKFDTVAGSREILSRRIGRNELNAIQACLAYYDAQHEYIEQDHAAKGVRAYAQRIVSNPGKKDGLYWPASQNGDQSPLGELVAKAAAEGYRINGERAPFHGYYYKILTKQGPAAKGGELDYVVRGDMMGGFALVAYPASYGVSGVMTFLVNHNGVVYEKNLGPQTARIAERITSFDPGAGWEPVKDTVSPPSQQ